MADDYYSRPPRQNPYARPQNGRPQDGRPQDAQRAQPRANDPLAELARLIGQNSDAPSRASGPEDEYREYDPGHGDPGYGRAAPYGGNRDRLGYGASAPQEPPAYREPPVYREPTRAAPAHDPRQQAQSQFPQSQFRPQDQSYGDGRSHAPSYGRPHDERGVIERGMDQRGLDQSDFYRDRPGYQEDDYAPQDYAAQDYSPQDYAQQNYARQDYAPQDYGRPDYAPRPSAEQSFAEPPFAPPPAAEPGYGAPQFSTQQFSTPQFSTSQFPALEFASPKYEGKPYPAYDNQLYFQQEPAAPPMGQPQTGQHHAGQTQAGAFPGGQFPPAHQAGPSYAEPPYAVTGREANRPEYNPGYDEAASAAAGALLQRRRGGMKTVIAVLVLAVVGTAAAFGYRTIFVAKNAGTPPLIKADNTPSKIAAGPGDSKPIQDRVGAQTERLVPREEQPVDVQTAVAAPRAVFPGNSVSPLPNAPILANPNAAGSAPTEPKKIRTIPIRSDQPEMAAVASAASAAGAPAQIPAQVPGQVPGQVPAQVPAQAPVQSSPTASAAPMAIAPGAAPAPRAANPAPRAAPARTASAPANAAPAAAAPTGGYGVQVSAQRSESEAQAAFAALRTKFPGVLGGRQVVIRRADLGEKGIYYRAQVPFATQSEAVEFCTSLKNAGGQCLVQRN